MQPVLLVQPSFAVPGLCDSSFMWILYCCSEMSVAVSYLEKYLAA